MISIRKECGSSSSLVGKLQLRVAEKALGSRVLNWKLFAQCKSKVDGPTESEPSGKSRGESITLQKSRWKKVSQCPRKELVNAFSDHFFDLTRAVDRVYRVVYHHGKKEIVEASPRETEMVRLKDSLREVLSAIPKKVCFRRGFCVLQKHVQDQRMTTTRFDSVTYVPQYRNGFEGSHKLSTAQSNNVFFDASASPHANNSHVVLWSTQI